MNFVPVAELPKPTKPSRTNKHNYQKEFDNFMALGVKYARIDWTKEDYASYNSACAAIRTGLWKFNIPAQLVEIDGTIYLVRTDI